MLNCVYSVDTNSKQPPVPTKQNLQRLNTDSFWFEPMETDYQSPLSKRYAADILSLLYEQKRIMATDLLRIAKNYKTVLATADALTELGLMTKHLESGTRLMKVFELTLRARPWRSTSTGRAARCTAPSPSSARASPRRPRSPRNPARNRRRSRPRARTEPDSRDREGSIQKIFLYEISNRSLNKPP